MLKKFSFSGETRAIREIARQIADSYTRTSQDSIDPEHLILMRPLLRKKVFTSFCSIIRANPEGLKRCRECDRRLLTEVKDSGKACYHRCHAGLIDFAFPVKRGGKLVPVVGGQLFFSPPSARTVTEILEKTRDLPVDRKSLQKAVKSIPVIPLQTVKGIVALLNSVLTGLPEVEIFAILGRLTGNQSTKDRRLQSAVSFIKENYSGQFSTREIAQKIGVTPDYLSHLFRKELEMTVLEYRDRLRINAAKRLLSDTDTPVTQIAFSLGWNDSNYFSNVFTGETGLSPSAFRKSRKKDRKLQISPQKT